MDQPNIVSDWAPADQSKHHLELALTDQLVRNNGQQQQVIALRDTHAPDQVIYVTPGQVQSFGKSVSTLDSPPGRLLAAASSGSTSR